VRALGAAFVEPAVRGPLTDAYVADTRLLARDVGSRESIVPARLCALEVLGSDVLRSCAPIGAVAVMIPKTSVGLSIAKAVVGAYLVGNRVRVRFPAQLARSQPLFADLIRRHLPGVEVVERCSGPRFLEQSFDDPEVQAVVVYGDDHWIGEWRSRAESSATRVLFEGPGNDPLVVLPGADLEAAVDAALRGGLLNGGQSCSAFERFLVHRSLHDDFVDGLCARLDSLRVGPPEDERSDVGPIASGKLRERLAGQLRDALLGGARVVRGGAFVAVGDREQAMEPAVLTGCGVGARAWDEENFGPLFPVAAWDSHSDLMATLQAARHGLNAAAFGPCPDELRRWLVSTHRNAYFDATQADPDQLPTRLADGGMLRSAFLWEPTPDGLRERRGRRLLPLELTDDPDRTRLATEALLADALAPGPAHPRT
jgi:acyl-CoA reductase-like NAD-dependent aldehyde dehydrogenase